MQLTIYRGTKEIGGSCVEVATATTRIVLDIGLPLVDAAREPFDAKSIRNKTVEELLSQGTLPKIRGLFDNGQPPDAVLLSHSHLEAGGKSLLYSGDLRMHGRKPGMMKRLINAISPRKIDVLLMEGTHFGSENVTGTTEWDLEEEIVPHIQSATTIVMAAFSPVDLDRLVTFYRAAQRTGRTFVVDAYAALILHLVASEAKVPRPTREAGMRVYFNQAFEQRNLERIKDLFGADRIALDEILAQPKQHLMVFRPSMVELDFGGTLPAQSRCLYSYWKGYLKNPDWVSLQKQLAEVGGDFVPVHASGHIYIADLIEFVKAIAPRTVIPIHTFEPGAFCLAMCNS